MIVSNKYKISVVGGAGHIGLPLSCVLQNTGNPTTIVDINEDSIKKIKQYKLPFFEKGLQKHLEIALDSGLNLTTSIESINSSEVIFVTLGTSSDKNISKKFAKTIDKIIENCKENSILILRSTVEKNICTEITKKPLFIKKKLKLAYCPERIAEGQSVNEITSLPQIIGTLDRQPIIEVENIFKSIGVEIIYTDFSTSEFLKLFSNTYRYLHFSLVNEFYNIAQENNIDFNEVQKLATYKYPRLSNLPEHGFIGGPCLIKDTNTFKKSYSKKNSLINNFIETNETYVKNVLDKCSEIFESQDLIFLGLTFKPESDDLRSSVSLKVYKSLLNLGFKIYPVDPYLKDSKIKLYKYDEVENLSSNVLISTNHKVFQKINFKNKKVIKIGKN